MIGPNTHEFLSHIWDFARKRQLLGRSLEGSWQSLVYWQIARDDCVQAHGLGSGLISLASIYRG